MTERWRSPAARDLVRAVRQAGGTVERVGVGRLRVTAPDGRHITLAEPGSPTRRDLRRSAVARLIKRETGLSLE